MSVLLTRSSRQTGQPPHVRPYGLLEVAHRKRFDDLTNLAATLTQTPVAFIAVDVDGQWHLRAHRGLGTDFIDDLIPMCRYACAQRELTMLSRTKNESPPVEAFWPDALEMKFVALVPLVGADGHVLGCLGVMDGTARRLTAPQQTGLWALSRQAAAQVELRRSLTKLARANAGQVRAERALAAERNLLRAVIDSVPDNLHLKDNAGRYILDNVAHLRFLGAATADDVLGKTVFDFFPAEQAQKFATDDQTVLRWGEALLNLEEVACDQAGLRHDLLTSKIPLRDEHGQTVGLICISHDITGRKQAEAAGAQLAAIVADSTDAIYSKSLDGIIRTWNTAAERLYGYTAAEIIGRSVRVLSPPERGDEIERIQRQIAQGWRVPTFETERLRKDGRRVEVSLTVSPLRNAAGRVTGASVIARDITDRRQKARDLEALNRRLTETLRDLHRTQHELVQTERLQALGQMASGIAHDFNNALAPILGYSELLLTRPDAARDFAKLSRFLTAIHSRATEAAQIVDRLKGFYRFGDDPAELRRVNLNRLVDEALALLRPTLAAQGPALHVETALAPLPDIAGVAAEIREAITHLAGNACEALRRKGQPGTVRFATRVYGDHVILEVIDTGSGMNEDTRRRCLEPFFTTKSGHGSGLGLAMVYGMIKRHDGLINIDSAEGTGTTVCLCFPIPTKRADNGTPGEVAPAGRALRVLLVDDEPDVREVTAEFLRADGHTIDTAATGQEALAKFQAGQYDAVVTDRAMPEMAGEELARAIKELNPAMPVVLLTGFGGMMNEAGEKPAGVDLVLGKPIAMNKLQAAIAQLVVPA